MPEYSKAPLSHTHFFLLVFTTCELERLVLSLHVKHILRNEIVRKCYC